MSQENRLVDMYLNSDPVLDKFLHSDGSITDSSGNILVAANPNGVQMWKNASPIAAKWLLSDGTISETMPGGGGGSAPSVLSVNGKSGAVVLTASDVGAATTGDISALDAKATAAKDTADSAMANANDIRTQINNGIYPQLYDAKNKAYAAYNGYMELKPDVETLKSQVSGITPDITALETRTAALETYQEYAAPKIDGAVQTTEKGVADGVAPLDENAKIPVEFLPDMASGYSMLGTYDASTNTPDIITTPINNKEYYVVDVPGVQSFDGGVTQVNLTSGSFIIRENGAYEFIIASSGGGGGSGNVYSVNGKMGVVVLSKSDIGLSDADNTSDVNKPVSTLQKAYIDEKDAENKDEIDAVSERLDKFGGENETIENAVGTIKDDLDAEITARGLADDAIRADNTLNYTQKEVMPSPGSSVYKKIYQYTGATNSNFTRGYFYRCAQNDTTYEYFWERIDTMPSSSGGVTSYDDLTEKPAIDGNELASDSTSASLNLQKIMQYSTMPVASNEYLGKIFQYIGNTTAEFKQGYFYRCEYDTESTTYSWVEKSISSDAGNAAKIAELETNQGDMSTLEVPSSTSIVDAINKVHNKAEVSSIVYNEPKLVITYNDGSHLDIPVDDILKETQIGELQNVLDDTIQNGEVLQYDTAISRYKPYAVLTALQNLFDESKAYTDRKVSDAIVAAAYVCDEKPSYDAENDTVIYKQNGVIKTTTQTDARFYYNDASGNPMCTSWIEDIEFTFSVSDANFDDYVNKNADVTSTYTGEEVDKSKVPNLGALDALAAIIANYLALKLNVDDVIDGLNSERADAALSARQGKNLNTLIGQKNNIFQYAVVPAPSAELSGRIIQYTGETSGAYRTGHFYRCSGSAGTLYYAWSDGSTTAYTLLSAPATGDTVYAITGGAVSNYDAVASYDAENEEITLNTSGEVLSRNASGDTTVGSTLAWVEIAFAADTDDELSSTSTNPVQNRIITSALGKKNELFQIAAATDMNAIKNDTGYAANIGKIYQFTGTTDVAYTNGYFYRLDDDDGTKGKFTNIYTSDVNPTLTLVTGSTDEYNFSL